MLLQEYLLRQALKEYDIVDAEIQIDHKNGKNTVNSIELGIKYPQEYLEKISTLNQDKLYDYGFVGSLTDGKGRKEILEKYHILNSKISHSSNGRNPKVKYGFDTEYYQTMVNSKFSLCPGHPAMPKHPNRWTYRFIESAFCRSIPVNFKETVYGDNFVKDIFFVWDDDVPCEIKDYNAIVEQNYITAVTRWTLQPSEAELIKKNS